MSALDQIARLRRIAEQCRGGQLGADFATLAQAIDHYLAAARDGVTLDRAIGVVAEQGRAAWWTEEPRQERNAALRQLYAIHCAPNARSRRAALLLLQSLVGRYSRDRHGWEADRQRGSPPAGTEPHSSGALLFAAFRAQNALDEPFPTSVDQLGEIVSACSDAIMVPGERFLVYGASAPVADCKSVRETNDAPAKENSLTAQRRRRRGRA